MFRAFWGDITFLDKNQWKVKLVASTSQALSIAYFISFSENVQWRRKKKMSFERRLIVFPICSMGPCRHNSSMKHIISLLGLGVTLNRVFLDRGKWGSDLILEIRSGDRGAKVLCLKMYSIHPRKSTWVLTCTQPWSAHKGSGSVQSRQKSASRGAYLLRGRKWH